MRVLAIEDEAESLNVIARALRENGYAVDEACDGNEGLYKATTSAVFDAQGWQVSIANRERAIAELKLPPELEGPAGVPEDERT